MTNEINQPIIFPTHSTIRVLRLQNRKRTPVVPIVDISKSIGVDRKFFHKIIDRNKELFVGLHVPVTGTSNYQKKLKNGQTKTVFFNQDLNCLTKEGIVGCLIKISADRIKDPTLQTKIIDFQRKVIKIIDAVIDGRLPKDFRLNFYDILGLPTGSLIADGVRQYSKEKGISVKTGYRHLRIARTQNGLEPSTKKTRSDKGTTKYPEEKARVLEYIKNNSNTGYKAVSMALGLQHIKYTVRNWLKEAA